MALVLSVEEGRSFFVGDIEIVVEKVVTPERHKLRIKGEAMDKIIEVDAHTKLPLVAEVTVQAGPDTGHPQLAKLVLEAPRHVKILRDNLYFNL